MALTLTNEDLNGECFILGAEGEIESQELSQILWFPAASSRPGSWPHNQALGSVPQAQMATTSAYLSAALWGNFHKLKADVQGINDQDAFRIAYLRMLVIREGLADPESTAASHHVRYNIARYLGTDDDTSAPNPAPTGSDAAWRNSAREKFTNMVCIVAYFFRVRGHHFQDSFEDRFKVVWKKCLYNEDDPGLKWEYIARHALHAIFPDTLDAYWVNSAEVSACAGALTKRVNSVPAGIAGVAALRRGLDDIVMILPKIPTLVPDAVSHLEDIERQILGNRWNGSINRRFYNAQAIRVDEGRLGSLAAVILAALDQFAGNNPLSKSNALKRIADNAPITGAVIARLIATAVNTPEAASGLLLEPVSGAGL